MLDWTREKFNPIVNPFLTLHESVVSSYNLFSIVPHPQFHYRPFALSKMKRGRRVDCRINREALCHTAAA